MSKETQIIELLKRKVSVLNVEIQDGLKILKLYHAEIQAENEILKAEVNALKQYVDLMDQ